MSRRSTLPGAAELFRSTGEPVAVEAAPEPAPAVRTAATLAPVRQVGRTPVSGSQVSGSQDGAGAQDAGPGDADPVGTGEAATRSDEATGGARGTRRRASAADRRPSGRERHDEKITVYVSPEELMDLEHARLALRGEHGLAVDRGRIVREALAVVIADLEAKGEDSIIVRRLVGR